MDKPQEAATGLSQLQALQTALVKRLRSRYLRLYVLLVAGLVLIAAGLTIWLWPARERHYQLTIVSGSPLETRNSILTYLSRKALKIGVDLKVGTCDGSIIALDMIESGELDMALIQGVVRLPKDTTVRHVTTFYNEPLHLLVKKKLHKLIKESQNIRELAGCTINVSQKGTATNLLAAFLLKYIGLKPDKQNKSSGYTAAHLSNAEILHAVAEIKKADPAARKILRGQLPDAFIVINTLPSRLASALIKNADYRLVSVPFGKAISMISVEEEVHDSDGIDQLHLEIVKIPAYTYGVSPPVPAKPLETLGVPMILVAHRDVPDEAVTRLLSLIYSGPVNNIYHPPALARVAPEYPFHTGSIKYRDRNQPMLRADAVDAVGRILSVGGPLLGGILAIYGFYRWRRLLRFRAYFRRLLHLETIVVGALDNDENAHNAAEQRKSLDKKLYDLQRQALTDFCDNYFFGDGVLENLLFSIAEVRRQIPAPQLVADERTMNRKVNDVEENKS